MLPFDNGCLRSVSPDRIDALPAVLLRGVALADGDDLVVGRYEAEAPFICRIGIYLKAGCCHTLEMAAPPLIVCGLPVNRILK